MKLIKDYMKHDALRHELNVLTEATFGFHFENWVTDGYFTGDYIPYSLEENGQIISNISANIMRFAQNGTIRNYIQLGTVMTAVEHRNKGLAGQLMDYVVKEYEDKCDGIYLFGDLSALDFYRKMGFQERMQYIYTLRKDAGLAVKERSSFQPISSGDAHARKHYLNCVRKSIPYGAFDQINKYGLQMFYTSSLKNVYYSPDLNCYIVLSRAGETLELKSVISEKYIPLEEILRAIHMEYKDLKLGFTPPGEALDLFDCTAYDGGDDYRLFCLGEKLDSIEKEKLYFPALSHA